jgi:uncharacterized iron-regulated membrane protein
MKRWRLRRMINRMHLYLGLAALLPLIMLSLTGALLVFETEIDHWLNPHLWYVTPQAQRLSYQTLYEQVKATFPTHTITSLSLPLADDLASVFFTEDERMIHLDPYRGTILGERMYGQTVMGVIYTLHVSFFAGDVGSYLAGTAALILLGMIGTGLYLWWPRGAHKRRSFVVKWRAPWRRTNYDLHRTVGFYASLVLLVIALTGVIFTFSALAEPLVYWLTHSSPPNRHPEVTPQVGVSSISIDAALTVSGQHVPNSTPTTVMFPDTPQSPLRITRRLPWQPVVTGRTYIFLNPYTGAVVQEISPRTAPLGTQLLFWNYPLHVGVFGGIVTRLLWLLASLLPTMLAITGALIWCKPRRRRPRSTPPATPNRQSVSLLLRKASESRRQRQQIDGGPV